MDEVRFERLGRSALHGVLLRAWQFGSRLVLTPWVLDSVGIEGYGVWGLMFSLCAYFAMFNASFSQAYTKLTAEYAGNGRMDELSPIITAGVLSVSLVGSILLLTVIPFSTAIMELLRVPAALVSDGSIVLIILLGVTLLRLGPGCFLSILAGLQRTDLEQRVLFWGSVAEFGVTLFFLSQGHGLLGLAWGYAAGQLLTVSLAWRISRRLAPGIRAGQWRSVRWHHVRSIVSLGGNFQLLAFLVLLAHHGFKIILAATAGMYWIGVFELASKLVNLGTLGIYALLSPLMPAFANLASSKNRERADQLFVKASSVVVSAALASMSLIALFASELLFVWTGRDVDAVVWAVWVMAPCEVLVLLTGVGTARLRAEGTLALEYMFAIQSAVLMVLATAPLEWIGGFEAVIVGRSCILSGAAIWFLVAHERRRRSTLRAGTTAGVLARAVVANLPAVGAGVLLPLLVPGGTFGDTRIHHFVVLLGWAVVYVGLSLGAAWFMVLDARDRSRVLAFLPWGRNDPA